MSSLWGCSGASPFRRRSPCKREGIATIHAGANSENVRAFLFAACGAIAATLFGVRIVELFENGVGSINFPPMMGMIFGPFSTRGSHPEFLRRMSVFCTEVMENHISFQTSILKSNQR